MMILSGFRTRDADKNVVQGRLHHLEPADTRLCDNRGEELLGIFTTLQEQFLDLPQVGHPFDSGQAFEDGFITTIYLDAKTYLVYKVKQKAPNQMGMEVDQEVFTTDYKKVDGIMIAHEMRILEDGEEAYAMIFSEVAFNSGLEDSFFKKEE